MSQKGIKKAYPWDSIFVASICALIALTLLNGFIVDGKAAPASLDNNPLTLGEPYGEAAHRAMASRAEEFSSLGVMAVELVASGSLCLQGQMVINHRGINYRAPLTMLPEVAATLCTSSLRGLRRVGTHGREYELFGVRRDYDVLGVSAIDPDDVKAHRETTEYLLDYVLDQARHFHEKIVGDKA